MQWLKERILITNWSVLPDWLWQWTASPLLHWAGLRRPDGKIFAKPYT